MSDVMQDKGHHTANSPTFKMMSPGNHAYKSHKYHIHHRFSSIVILLGIWVCYFRKLSTFEKELLAQGHMHLCSPHAALLMLSYYYAISVFAIAKKNFKKSVVCALYAIFMNEKQVNVSKTVSHAK